MREILTRARISPRAADLCAALGVSARRPPGPPGAPFLTPRLDEAARTLARRLRQSPGLVVAVTGPSGSGKSTLLRRLARLLRRRPALPPDSAALAAVDAVGGRSARAACEALARAGLAEAAAMIRTPRELSDGQRHRLALARAVAARGPVLIDEFASCLDRLTAMGLCVGLARWARASRRTVVAATAHDDVVEWLRPDLHAVVPLAGPVRIIEPKPAGRRRRGT